MIKLNIQQIKNMFVAGAAAISEQYEYINELNVFPVPDGDTGSNMKITAEGAVNVIKGMEFKDLFTLGRQFSRALLMNARGNSGVIFSQIIKGFVSVFKENTTELTIGEFADAFSKAKEAAYRAVTTPIEGTILTVIRVTAENIDKKKNTYKSIQDLMIDVIKEAKDILEQTPDFLPELKNAGVVDSGGYGLVCFFEGMEASFTASPDKTKEIKKPSNKKPLATKTIKPTFVDNNDGFGYCCEFIAKLGSKVVIDQKDKEILNEKALKKELLEIGDSLAIVRDEDILKVHVHSVNPYKVLQIGQKYGEFSKVKVENMTFQFLERNPGMTLEKSSKKTNLSQKPAVIATIPTQKLTKLFIDDLAVNYVINCEKNGNPSIQEFIDALNAVKSAKILLLVDDGNMVLAANEAISLFTNTNRGAKVNLINTKDIAATYNLCLAYNPEEDFDTNIKKLSKDFKLTAVGKISKSVKMVKYSHIDVKKNDYIGIIDKKIISSSKNIETVIKQTFTNLFKINKKAKNAYIFYGTDVAPATLNIVEKEWMEKYGMKLHFIPSNESIYLFHFALR